MKKIVHCKLEIESNINDKTDKNTIIGKGYYNDDNEEVIVYFSNNNNKYKYIYNKDTLIIQFNDSIYKFKLNSKEEGVIKNGDYVLKITTCASKIEVYNNCINLDYELRQKEILLGKYKTTLSLK